MPLANTALILKPHLVLVPNHTIKPEPEKWAIGLMVSKEYNVKFFDTEEGPGFQFYDEINGGFRIGLVKDVIEKPNGRMMGQYAKAKNDLANVGKEDKKKK
jgi:hypothetical protein